MAEGLGFGASGLGFRVYRVAGLGFSFRVRCLGIWVILASSSLTSRKKEESGAVYLPFCVRLREARLFHCSNFDEAYWRLPT